MQAFTHHRGLVVAMDRAHVDTDQVIPKQFLKRIERSGFGQFLFFDWRFLPDGSVNPDFELNRPGSEGASILLAQMSDMWTEAHYDDDRASLVAAATEAVETVWGPLPEPIWTDTQRWRYSLPDGAADGDTLAEDRYIKYLATHCPRYNERCPQA